MLLQDSDLFFFGSLLESVCLGMAPKSVLWARTKKAGKMLAAQKEVDMLAKQKKEIRMSMSKLQKEKKGCQASPTVEGQSSQMFVGRLVANVDDESVCDGPRGKKQNRICELIKHRSLDAQRCPGSLSENH